MIHEPDTPTAFDDRRRDGAAMVVLATLSLSVSILINAGVVCSNDGSQYALIRALADDGTATIDRYAEYTRGVDYAVMDGHRYSDRPPHVAFLAMPVYVIARAFGLDDVGRQTAVTGVAHVAGMLVVLLLFALARRLGASRVGAFAAAFALAWCTPLRSYAATLFSHAITAALVTAVVLLVLPSARPLEGGSRSRRRLASQLLAGFLGGYACGADYTAGLPVALACGWGAWAEASGKWADFGKITLTYVAGGLVGAAPALAYHTVVFGSPWSLPYFFDARFEYAHSVGGMYGGSFFDGFFGLLVSPRAGLVFWSPILALALGFVPTLYRALGRDRFLLVTLPWVGLYLVTARNLTWDAGASQDVRYLLSVLPLIALPLAWGFDWAFGVRGRVRPIWLSVMGFAFFTSALMQIVKHNAVWVRNGEAWIGWIGSSLSHDPGPTLLGFARWAYPHPVAALTVLCAGLALAVVVRGTSRGAPSAGERDPAALQVGVARPGVDDA